MTKSTNVFAKKARPSTKSYRSAVAAIIRTVQAQHHLCDGELAEQIGCSIGTIRNARNEMGNLDGVFLANLQWAFGPDTLDPLQALSDARGVPESATCSTDVNPIIKLAEAIGKLAETQREDSENGQDTGPTEAVKLLPVLRQARAVLDHEIARITPLATLRSVG